MYYYSDDDNAHFRARAAANEADRDLTRRVAVLESEVRTLKECIQKLSKEK